MTPDLLIGVGLLLGGAGLASVGWYHVSIGRIWRGVLLIFAMLACVLIGLHFVLAWMGGPSLWHGLTR